MAAAAAAAEEAAEEAEASGARSPPVARPAKAGPRALRAPTAGAAPRAHARTTEASQPPPSRPSSCCAAGAGSCSGARCHPADEHLDHLPRHVVREVEDRQID